MFKPLEETEDRVRVPSCDARIRSFLKGNPGNIVTLSRPDTLLETEQRKEVRVEFLLTKTTWNKETNTRQAGTLWTCHGLSVSLSCFGVFPVLLWYLRLVSPHVRSGFPPV